MGPLSAGRLEPACRGWAAAGQDLLSLCLQELPALAGADAGAQGDSGSGVCCEGEHTAGSGRGPRRPRCPRGEERGKGAAGGSETSLLFRAPSCCFLLALSKSAPFPAALALGFLTVAVLGSVPGLGVRAELPAHVFVFTAISPFAIFPQEILQLTQAAIKKVLENYLQMPDWALEAIGMQTESLTALTLCMALPQGLPGFAFKPEKNSLMHCFNS